MVLYNEDSLLFEEKKKLMQSKSTIEKGRSIRNFLRYARNHRIPIHPETRKIGIACTLIGWAFIGFIEKSAPIPSCHFSFFFNFFIQFLAGTFLLLIASLCMGKDFLKVKESTEIRTEDQQQHIAHLNVTQRKSLIFWRGLIAIIGYILYSWAKSNTQIIDNSAAFSSDAIIYALIMACFFKQKINRLQWITVATVFMGVCFIVSFDIFGISHGIHGLWSFLIAIAAAGSLAVIILLNSVIIQHEPPLRVAFMQCLIGLACMTLLIGVWLIFNPASIHLVSMSQVVHSFVTGTIYAISLILFFNAFLYVEPFIIVMLGYSIFPFVVFFSWSAGNIIPIQDFIGSFIITFGGLLSVFLQYKEDKKNTHGNIAGYPIYISTLARKFKALKEDFFSGRLGDFEYLSQRHEFNKLLFEYAEQINLTEISKIEIEKDKVLFTLKPFDFKMLSDGGCRSAPLEILNFNSYEENESCFVFQMVQDKDTIIEIGANLGWYSIQFAIRFPNSKIYSFEPVPRTFSFLEKNIELNNIENIQIYNLGMADAERVADFFYFKSGSAVASMMNLLDHESATKIKCSITTLDLIVASLNIQRLDFIKCDVEGAELSVIQGGLESIRKFLPIIYIELYHGWCEKFDYRPDDVMELLKNCGYECFEIHKKSLKRIKNIVSTSKNCNFFFLNKQKHKDLIARFTS